MPFQLHALSGQLFEHLFALSDDDLHAQSARRIIADADVGYPCRISLQDAKIGDEVILANYKHLDGLTPYAASHAIYIRKGVERAVLAAGTVPEMLSSRLLSVRGFDAQDLMVDADIIEGDQLSAKLPAMFADPAIRFVDIHYAKRGCFAAKATRA